MADDIRNTLVADIMTTRIEMVDEETPISFAAKLLVDKRISGLPVTDDDGAVSGVISAADLMRAVGDQHGEGSPSARGFYAAVMPRVLSNQPSGGSVSPPDGHVLVTDTLVTDTLVTDTLTGTVGDYMTAALVSVTPDATVGATAKLMSEERVSRVLVLDRNRNLAGLVTQSDIVRLVGGAASKPAG